MKVSSGDGCYIWDVLDPDRRRQLVEQAKVLLPHVDRFDAIAVRGMSGALFGALLAYLLNKNIIAVRKKGDVENHQSHSNNIVEGLGLAGDDHGKTMRYLIVDDFKCTGTTINIIKETIGDKAVFVGTYLYRDEELTWHEDPKTEAAKQPFEEPWVQATKPSWLDGPGLPKKVRPKWLPPMPPTDWASSYYCGIIEDKTKGLIPDFLMNKVNDSTGAEVS